MTRFAPAPTGYLHLGHVANALFVWGLARLAGVPVLLRVEDHDRTRSRPEFERALLDDLDWLGFAPDVWPTSAFREGPCASRQSNRGAIYAAAADRLRARGLLYGCDCTRQDLARTWSATTSVGDEHRYPGTCRTKQLPLADGVVWRLRLEPGIERFDDWLAGPQAQDPSAQCGDVVVRDRIGQWTYQFAASVDDAEQGVTLVVRGRDLLASTGRQIQIARLLGRSRPAQFAHHPLIMKSDTQKLSKSDRDTGVRDLRATGWSISRVLHEAAARAGLPVGKTPVSPANAADLLSAAGVRARDMIDH